MRILYFLAEVFINTFGITQPASPEQRRRVSLVLGGFLLAVILAILGITSFLLSELHLGR